MEVYTFKYIYIYTTSRACVANAVSLPLFSSPLLCFPVLPFISLEPLHPVLEPLQPGKARGLLPIGPLLTVVGPPPYYRTATTRTSAAPYYRTRTATTGTTRTSPATTRTTTATARALTRATTVTTTRATLDTTRTRTATTRTSAKTAVAVLQSLLLVTRRY